MAVIAPHIANGIVILVTFRILRDLSKQSDSLIKSNNFKMLPVLHHFSSGLKALASEMMYIANDELRQSCGGAGFCMASGITGIFLNAAPVPTFEGVNVMML